MRFFLSAQYPRREELNGYAKALAEKGHTVVSRWLRGTHEAADGDQSRWEEFAVDDIGDIQRSDAVVVFTEHEMTPRGSRHVEYGIALASHKAVIVVGPVENIFHTIHGVRRFETPSQFIEAVPDISDQETSNGEATA